MNKILLVSPFVSDWKARQHRRRECTSSATGYETVSYGFNTNTRPTTILLSCHLGRHKGSFRWQRIRFLPGWGKRRRGVLPTICCFQWDILQEVMWGNGFSDTSVVSMMISFLSAYSSILQISTSASNSSVVSCTVLFHLFKCVLNTCQHIIT